jgi:hypothetical protein
MVGSVADSSTSGGSFALNVMQKTQCSKLVMSFVKGANAQCSPNSGNGTVMFVGSVILV